ncbi:MAG: hypothetical protein ACR2LQ_12535 [Acidimicrobiales bacterium]
MRYFLGLLAAVALVAGATKLGYDRFENEINTKTAAKTSTQASTTTLPPIIPSADQVVVVGVVSNAHIESALLDPLLVPLTITTPERGLSASGTFTGVTIDGAESSIHWDAGTPLQLGSAGETVGSLAVGAVTLDADASNMVVSFPDDEPQGISPDSFKINSPVAVAAGSGLSTARDNAAFEATPTATVTFTGGASTTFATKALTARGPGKVVLNGSLTLVRPDRSQSKITSITLDKGPFTLSFTPDVNGLKIQATLQGTVTTS